MNHGWEKKRLGDICQINFGKRIVAKDTQSGPYYVYGGGGATFTTKDYNRENCMIVSRFAMSPECVRFVRGRFFLNDSGLSVDSITDSLTQEFVDKYLWAIQPQIYNLGRGAAQKNLNTKSFSELTIPLPPVNIQLKIISEIDKLNELIEIKRRQLYDLDSLAQSLFYETFGDPIENPKGWETKLFGDLVRLKSGEALSAKNFCNGQYPVYGGNGIAGYHNKYNLSGQNIIIGRVGALCGNIRLVNAEIFVTDNAFVVNLQQNMNLRFLERLLALLELRKYANAAAQPVISNISLKAINVPIPAISLQNEFAERIDAIEEQKRRIESSIADLETLLASRMDYWFND